jgi:redox-sensing transcriptional repressor
MKHLPHKTIERLSQYRRALLMVQSRGKTHIFSHEIAKIIHITPVQVRRDIMLIGYTGTLRKGYDVSELIKLIGKIIDSDEGLNG